ncbi:MAG: hypothetical protein J2O48_13225, partial [Solirubrobacterales bacterium]|nr:hypothetical protein [Solirubrobacterales bacterium]
QRVELGGGITVLDDSYNANPMSMRAALDELAAGPATRRIAVLGDMLELGPGAAEFHRQVGAYASERANVLVSVGPLSAAMGEGYGGEHHHVDDATGAAELVRGLVQPGDVVLVKASRGVGLERVVEHLRSVPA